METGRTGPVRVSGQVEASPRARERMNGGLKAGEARQFEEG